MAGLIHWRGRNEVDRFRGEIDRLFDDFFIRSPFGRSFERGEWVPAVDIAENEKEIEIHAEVPGMDAKDIDIALNGRLLTIKGDKNFYRVERSYGSFSKSFELPADVDASQVKAEYNDGLLKLNLPKTKEQSVRKIEVKSS